MDGGRSVIAPARCLPAAHSESYFQVQNWVATQRSGANGALTVFRNVGAPEGRRQRTESTLTLRVFHDPGRAFDQQLGINVGGLCISQANPVRGSDIGHSLCAESGHDSTSIPASKIFQRLCKF
jgi:hypothetical protein